jgi:uncharacterized membrane protein
MVLRINVAEVLLTVLISLIISITVGLTLGGLFEVTPDVGWELIALVLGAIVSITVCVTMVFYVMFKTYASERVVKVAMMTLSEKEQRVLGKIMEFGGEIRQDDLWRKLREDFSRSKLSQLVINLEKKHAVTRTRYGRTNVLKLTPEFSRR